MAEHNILFAAPINPETVNAFVQLLAQKHAQGATKVTIAMNSGGGSVVAGIMLYNVMRALPFEIVTHNVGNVDSIANVIFLAGAKRYACPPSTFMFHGVGFDTTGNQRFEEKRLESMLDTVLADQRRMSDLIADRTGLSTAVCMDLFKEQKTRDAAWAKNQGVVTDIADYAFPTGGNMDLFVR